MDDTIWDELLSSPYEDRKRHGRGGRGGPPWLIVAAFAGAIGLGALVGWGAAPHTDPIASPDTTTSTSTTSVPVTTAPGFLSGYTQLDETAFGPVVQFESQGFTYVGVVEIVASDADRTEVEPATIASYGLVDGGSQLSATRAITAVLTPGVRLIEFPGVASSAPITLVEGVSPVVNTLERTLAVPLAGGPIGPPFEGLPYESHEPNRIALTDDASLVIDDVVVDDDWGLITWSVESDRDIVVQPEFFIEYEGSDTDGNLALLVPSHSLGPRFGQSQPPSEPGFATAGIAQLSRLGPHITDSNPPTGLALYWNIRWTEPTSMTATIDAAPVFE